jgi:hypothetical protein
MALVTSKMLKLTIAKIMNFLYLRNKEKEFKKFPKLSEGGLGDRKVI